MKNIMLLGDSVRMAYDEIVEAEMGEGYKFFWPTENCRFSYYTLNSLRFWLPECPHPDVIHWNNGLWDVKEVYPDDGNFVDVEQYVLCMKRILRQLQNTGARVIFATTTPVSDKLQGFSNEKIIEYNAAVLKTFEGEDVIINDLHSKMYPNKDEYLADDLIHPSEKGKLMLGRAVSDAIARHKDYTNPYRTDGEGQKILPQNQELMH